MIPLAVKHRGLPPALAKVYHGWVIEDIQEESRGFYADPVYGQLESTKNYLDTGEQLSLVSIHQEEQPPSDDNNVDEEGEEGGGGSDDEGHEEMDEAFRGGDMSPSARWMTARIIVVPPPSRIPPPPLP